MLVFTYKIIELDGCMIHFGSWKKKKKLIPCTCYLSKYYLSISEIEPFILWFNAEIETVVLMLVK